MLEKKLKKYLSYIGLVRMIIPIIPFLLNKNFRRVVLADLERVLYSNEFPKGVLALNYALWNDYAYRRVYLYRLHTSCSTAMYSIACLLLGNPLKIALSSVGNVGDGLCIFHGQGCVLYLNTAGENLSVWQNVTIGRNPKTAVNGIDTPSFGDNVNVYANAVVIGNIHVGNNVSIGAGAVVTKSVPDNCTVVGNPMRIIHH